MNNRFAATLASFIGAGYDSLVLTPKAWIPSAVLAVVCVILAISYFTLDREKTSPLGRIGCVFMAILSMSLLVMYVLD